MLDKIYSVFVSSTYEDLREERAEVQKALLKAKCFPIGMELFPSTDEETWEFIKRQIDDADFYLLVIGGRYGSTDADGVSFTEKEYDYARQIKKPALAFIHANPGSIVSAKTDNDDVKRASLTRFIEKIQAKPLVSRYSSPHELGAQVLASIIDLKDTNTTAIGFVRGDRAADPKKYADVLEENLELKAKLELTRKNEGEPFPDANEQIQISFEILDKRGALTGKTIETKATWSTIFLDIAEQIITGRDIEDLHIESILKSKIHDLPDGVRLHSSKDRIHEIRSRMFAHKLFTFETVTRESQVSGPFTKRVWLLTENGRIWYRKLKHEQLSNNGKQEGQLKTSASTD